MTVLLATPAKAGAQLGKRPWLAGERRYLFFCTWAPASAGEVKKAAAVKKAREVKKAGEVKRAGGAGLVTTISPDRIAQIEARRDELQAQMATGDLPSDRFVAVRLADGIQRQVAFADLAEALR